MLNVVISNAFFFFQIHFPPTPPVKILSVRFQETNVCLGKVFNFFLSFDWTPSIKVSVDQFSLTEGFYLISVFPCVEIKMSEKCQTDLLAMRFLFVQTWFFPILQSSIMLSMYKFKVAFKFLWFFFQENFLMHFQSIR